MPADGFSDRTAVEVNSLRWNGRVKRYTMFLLFQ